MLIEDFSTELAQVAPRLRGVMRWSLGPGSVAVALGELERPAVDDPQADLIRRKGEEHEQAHLESLRTQGKTVVTIERGEATTTLEVERARPTQSRRCAPAPRSSTRPRSSTTGGAGSPTSSSASTAVRARRWSYEVADTKLARRAKP